MRQPVLRDLQGEGCRGTMSCPGVPVYPLPRAGPLAPQAGLWEPTAWSAYPALPIPGSYCHPLNRCAN